MTFERQKPLWWELAKALFVAAVAIAAFTGCAHTELRDPKTGRIVMRTEADGDMEYSNGSLKFKITKMDHSTTNRIMGKNFQNGATAVAAGVATSGILGIVH